MNDVSARLGYKFPLKMNQITDMFDMCRYDQAWNLEKPSAWCAAFTPTQVDALEYLEDISKYYKSGFGRESNSRISCSAVNDMLHNLDSENLPKATVYFAHSKSILLLLTALEAAKDSDSLRADNYHSMQDRKWRGSKITPFASNVAAIKYNCPNEMEHEKVMFFQNEQPIKFDWCKVGLCNWNDVKERYKQYAHVNCDEYFCKNSGTTSIVSTIASIILPLVTMIFIKLIAA